MKKSLFSLVLFFSIFAQVCFSQAGVVPADVGITVKPYVSEEKIPELLKGIWQGSDRLLLFNDVRTENGAESGEFFAVLRVFYGWYDERTAEPASYAQIKTRDRNDASAKTAEDIIITYRTIFENMAKNAGVYELEVKYPNIRDTIFIPVCVIDGKIYLDFLIRDSALTTDFLNSQTDSQNQAAKTDVVGTYYRAASNADGITVSSPRFKKEVTSYLVVEDAVYLIRYWESDMEYTYAKATFSDGNTTFTVDKYIRVGNHVYQCTTGRSSKIRNIKKRPIIADSTVFDSEKSICAFGPEYLVKVPNGSERTNLQEIIDENNKRRKAPPKPLFPPSEINFHWKEITELEKYNPYTWNRRNIDLGK